jgi:cell division protease FtsH
VIDEEVERILRQEEERAMTALHLHRGGLDLVAAALLEKETIDGAEVARLVDQAFGRPVHDHDGKAEAPRSLASAPVPDATANGGSPADAALPTGSG